MDRNDAAESEAIRRARDLSGQCARRNIVTATQFLDPAQQREIERAASREKMEGLWLFGGRDDCERKIAFFLPQYVEEEMLQSIAEEYICAVRVETKFSNPGHRDYLGAILGLGIKRSCIGDIYVFGETAYFYCTPSVEKHIVLNLDKIGRYGASARKIPLSDVPQPERKVKKVSFTVKSMRVDAVAAGMFSLSRTAMAELISEGALTFNYEECLKTDMPVSEGDVISVRGRGKGTVISCGGVSRKGRMFVEAEILG